MKTKPSEEAMRNFYRAVEPALIRIAKEQREIKLTNDSQKRNNFND